MPSSTLYKLPLKGKLHTLKPTAILCSSTLTALKHTLPHPSLHLTDTRMSLCPCPGRPCQRRASVHQLLAHQPQPN